MTSRAAGRTHGTVALSHPATSAPQDLRPSSANGPQFKPTGLRWQPHGRTWGPDAPGAQEDLPSPDHVNARCNSARRSRRRSTIRGQVPDRPGRVDQQGREPLNPSKEVTWSTSMARPASSSSRSWTTRTGGTSARPTGSPRAGNGSEEARLLPQRGGQSHFGIHRGILDA
jgi:hypothetical protein